jgi:glycerol-3-phosphate acyltransferase PlsY
MNPLIAGHIESLKDLPFPAAAVLLIAIACYFAGNINPAILIGKAYGVDVKREGSGNAGMTNAMRTVGKRAGAATFIIDALKGLLPTLIITHYAGMSLGSICGVLVVAGHIWPAVYRFSGGKGVSTCFGVLIALDFRLALILIAVVLVFALITKRVSAGTLIACAFAIPVAYFLNPMEVLPMALIIVLIVIGHRGNIKRLINGTEPKMSFANKDSEGSRDGEDDSDSEGNKYNAQSNNRTGKLRQE